MEEFIRIVCLKTTKAHFDVFKKECLNLQKKWGLSGWELYFQHTDLDNCYARCSTDLDGRLARIDFSTQWPEPNISANEIKNVAKHEMVHLVLARLYTLGLNRFSTEAEMEEASEETVRILEKLL